MTAMLLEERADGVLRLTLNRPEARNALSIELMNALLEALGRAAKEPGTRVVVIGEPVSPSVPGTICASCGKTQGARLTSTSSRCAAS